MLTRVPDVEPRLYDVLRTSFGTNTRTGIHLSSLLNPRQTHFKQTDPRPLNNEEIGYFIGGRGHEDALARLLGDDFALTAEEVIDGIHLRPDFVAVTDRVVPAGSFCEFKTRRSNLPKSDAEAAIAFESYRDQIRGYMALKGHPEMYLIVLSLLEGKVKGDPLSKSGPVFAVYKETMTDEELAEVRTDLQTRKTLLELGTFSLMPLCWQFLCVRWVDKKLTKHCPYYDDCQPYLTDERRQVHE